MKYFHDALDECSLMDLGFVGSKFTWFKKFSNGIFMWERLDRAVGTSDCFDKYPTTKVMILECSSSEHKPLLIYSCGVPVKFNKLWCSKQIWLKDEGCHDTVALA